MTQEQAQELDRQQRESDLRTMMGSPTGRRLVKSLLLLTRTRETTFTGDSLGSAFEEGRREVGVALERDLLGLMPDAWLQMEAEHIERVKERRLQLSAEPAAD